MAVGDIYRLQVQGRVQARKITNNFGYVQTEGGSPVNSAEELADAWDAAIKTAYLDLLSVDYNLQCVYVRGANRGEIIPFERGYGNDNGTRAAGAQPNNSSYVINLITDSNSSRDNGMFFISGFSDNDVSDGDLESTYLIGPLTAFSLLLDDDLSSGPPSNLVWAPAVIDSIQDGIPLIPKLANRITSAPVTPIIYTQVRRRTKGTGVGFVPPP